MTTIKELTSVLGNTGWFLSFDLKDRYWQIPLDEESKPLTAFEIKGKGIFMWNQMPFGLCNAPSIF